MATSSIGSPPFPQPGSNAAMKLIAPFVLFASLVAGSVGQSDFTISVADHTQCASTEITWENGVGPYGLVAWIERDGAAIPVIDTGSLEVTSYPFVNDAAAGYAVEIQVTENNGHNALVRYTITPGSNTSCLPGVGWGR
ncbi:hypothetical protein V8D89_014356 [Ganoderma adspersum]